MSEAFPSSTPSPAPDDMFGEGDEFIDPSPQEQPPADSAAPSVSNIHDAAPAAAHNDVAPARQVAPPRRTDHTYHDFATQTPSPYEYPVTKKSTSNFPAKLHRMISDPANAQAIQWQPHGRAWKVLDKELLVEVVIPKYFVQTKYESFTRQLSGWGFKRLHQTGPDYRCYYHECFLRGLPHLTRMMKRAEPNQGKLLPHVEAEPNFYEMDLRHPLPLPPSPAYPQPSAVGAYPYGGGHAAAWPPQNNAHYPYGYHGHAPPPPPPPPANYPPPPYDPYGYPYPQPQPGQMYPPPQGHDPYAGYPGAAAMPQPQHVAYGQAQPGYPDPHAYNMYPPPPPHPNHQHYPTSGDNAHESQNNNDQHESHPGY